MVFIDTDVLFIEFAFHRDARFPPNRRFMQAVRGHEPALTLFNLMEFLGRMSFNLTTARLMTWHEWLVRAHGLTVVWPPTAGNTSQETIRQLLYEAPLERFRIRIAYLDALIIEVMESQPIARAFVTWNVRHFRGKTRLPVQTPDEWLAAGGA